MDILALLLLTLLVFISTFVIINNKSDTDTDTQFGGSTNTMNFDSRNINEIRNVDNVLDRQVTFNKSSVNPIISNFGARINQCNSNSNSPVSVNSNLKTLIQYNQPYMFDEPEIINGKYYRDWKYPEKPINIKFLKDPVKYCNINPNEYPCIETKK